MTKQDKTIQYKTNQYNSTSTRIDNIKTRQGNTRQIKQDNNTNKAKP